MNPKVSSAWTPAERQYVIDKLQKRLMKPITGDDVETTMRKIERLQDMTLSAQAIEADTEWILKGLNIERA